MLRAFFGPVKNSVVLVIFALLLLICPAQANELRAQLINGDQAGWLGAVLSATDQMAPDGSGRGLIRIGGIHPKGSLKGKLEEGFIAALNGKNFTDTDEAAQFVSQLPPGSTLKLDYFDLSSDRNSPAPDLKTIEITLSLRPPVFLLPTQCLPLSDNARDWLPFYVIAPEKGENPILTELKFLEKFAPQCSLSPMAERVVWQIWQLFNFNGARSEYYTENLLKSLSKYPLDIPVSEMALNYLTLPEKHKVDQELDVIQKDLAELYPKYEKDFDSLLSDLKQHLTSEKLDATCKDVETLSLPAVAGLTLFSGELILKTRLPGLMQSLHPVTIEQIPGQVETIFICGAYYELQGQEKLAEKAYLAAYILADAYFIDRFEGAYAAMRLALWAREAEKLYGKERTEILWSEGRGSNKWLERMFVASLRAEKNEKAYEILNAVRLVEGGLTSLLGPNPLKEASYYFPTDQTSVYTPSLTVLADSLIYYTARELEFTYRDAAPKELQKLQDRQIQCHHALDEAAELAEVALLFSTNDNDPIATPFDAVWKLEALPADVISDCLKTFLMRNELNQETAFPAATLGYYVMLKGPKTTEAKTFASLGYYAVLAQLAWWLENPLEAPPVKKEDILAAIAATEKDWHKSSLNQLLKLAYSDRAQLLAEAEAAAPKPDEYGFDRAGFEKAFAPLAKKIEATARDYLANTKKSNPKRFAEDRQQCEKWENEIFAKSPTDTIKMNIDYLIYSLQNQLNPIFELPIILNCVQLAIVKTVDDKGYNARYLVAFASRENDLHENNNKYHEGFLAAATAYALYHQPDDVDGLSLKFAIEAGLNKSNVAYKDELVQLFYASFPYDTILKNRETFAVESFDQTAFQKHMTAYLNLKRSSLKASLQKNEKANSQVFAQNKKSCDEVLPILHQDRTPQQAYDYAISRIVTLPFERYQEVKTFYAFCLENLLADEESDKNTSGKQAAILAKIISTLDQENSYFLGLSVAGMGHAMLIQPDLIETKLFLTQLEAAIYVAGGEEGRKLKILRQESFPR